MSSTNYATALAAANGDGVRAFANAAVSAEQAAQTDTAFTAGVMANLGLTAAVIGQAAYDALLAGAAAYINSVGVANRGVVVVQLAQAVAALTSDATFGAAAANLNNASASAYAYSTNAANTADKVIDVTTEPAPVTTFTLTTSTTDLIVGTAGDDIINGDKDTFNAGTDQIVDASSTDNDTLNLTLSAVDVAATSVSGVENINVTSASASAPTANTGGVDAAKFSGVQNLTVSRADMSVGGATIAGDKAVQAVNVDASKVAKVTVGAGATTAVVLQTTKAGAVVNADAASGSVTVKGATTLSAAGAGAGDSVTVNVLSNATEDAKAVSVTTSAESVVVGAFTGAITVNAAASKSVLIAGASGGATVVATGESGTTGTDGIQVLGIDKSGASITSTYVGATKDSKEGAIQVGGTAATDDVVTISAAGVQNLDNDTAAVDIANLSGNGAAATYNITDLAFATYNITGAQDVTIADAAADFDGVTVTDTSTGVSTVVINGVVGGSEDLSKLAVDAIKFTVDAASTSTNTLVVASGANVVLAKDQTDIFFDGKTEKATLNVATADDTAASGATIDITVGEFNADTNFTTVNIDATVGKFTATTTNVGTAATLNVKGTKDVALGAITAKVLDATTATGKISLDTNSTALTKITTGASDDTIVVDQAVAYTLSAGAGKDDLTIAATSAAGGSFDLGEGDDVVALNDADAHVVVLGDGDDKITVAASLDVDSIMVGGNGTDTLVFANTADTDLSNNTNFAISGFEKIDVDAGGDITISAAQFANNRVFQLIGSSTSTDILKVLNASTTAGATIDASGVTFETTQEATLQLAGAAKLADVITGSAKNDTIIGSTGGDTIDGGAGTDTFLAADLKASTVEGTGTGTSVGVVVNMGDTAITNTSVLSATGGFTADSVTAVAGGTIAYTFAASAATNSAVTSTITNVENITGTSGKDYIVGSALANELNGGDEADYIDGGIGNDVIIGGAGADTLKGGVGVDTFVYSDKTHGADTISDFTIADDVLKFIDGTDLALDGTATKLFTKGTAAAVKTAIAGGGNAVGYNVIVLTDAVATFTAAGIDAALTTAFDNATTNLTTTGVIVIAAASTGNAKVWFDASAFATNAQAGAATYELATLTGVVLADLANLATGNFVIA